MQRQQRSEELRNTKQYKEYLRQKKRGDDAKLLVQRIEERKKAHDGAEFAEWWQQWCDDMELQYIQSEQQRTGKLQPETIEL